MEKEYFAFISYREDDYKDAKWLQKELEKYRLPTSIRKENPNLPERIRPVFEYKSEMAGGELKPEIDKALAGSQYLIVICSPNATKSPWVADEVQRFIDTGRTNKIIPFVVAGEAYSKDPAIECFPEPLRKLAEPKRGISINEMGRDAAVIKVIAEMLGVKFDSLWRRYEREQRRVRRMWFTFFISLAMIASGVAYWMSQTNTELENANSKLKKAFDDLDSAYVQIQKDSIIQAMHIERIQGDSVRIALQNDSINKVNNDLDHTINQLKQRERELLIANNDLRISQVKIHCENAERYITEDNSVDAKEELNKAMTLYKDLHPKTYIAELEKSMRCLFLNNDHKVQLLFHKFEVGKDNEIHWGDSTFYYCLFNEQGTYAGWRSNKLNGDFIDNTESILCGYPNPRLLVRCKHDQVLFASNDSLVIIHDLIDQSNDTIGIFDNLAAYRFDIESYNVVTLSNSKTKEFAKYHVSTDLVALKDCIKLNYPDGYNIQQIYGDSVILGKYERKDTTGTASYLVWDRHENRLLDQLDIISDISDRTDVSINPITHEYLLYSRDNKNLIFLPMMNSPIYDYYIKNNDDYRRMKGWEDCGYYHSVLDKRKNTYQIEHVANDTLRYLCKYKIDNIYERDKRNLSFRQYIDNKGHKNRTIDNTKRGEERRSLPKDIISCSYSEKYSYICVEYGDILSPSYKIYNAITLEEVYAPNRSGVKFQWRNDSVFTLTDMKHKMFCYTIKKENGGPNKYKSISLNGKIGAIHEYNFSSKHLKEEYVVKNIKTRETLNIITDFEREKFIEFSPNGQFAMLAWQKKGEKCSVVLYRINKDGSCLEPYKTYYLESDISDYEIRFCDDSKHFAVKEEHGMKENRFMLYSIESATPVYVFDIDRFVSDWWITPQNDFVLLKNADGYEEIVLKSQYKESPLPFTSYIGYSWVKALCFSKDCSKVVRGTYQGHVTLYNGIDYIDFDGVTGHVEHVDIDKGDEYVLALVSTNLKHFVFIWNINTQKKIAEIPLEGYPKQARFTTGESLNIIITEGYNSYLLPFGRMRDLIEQFDMNNNN